MYINKRQLRKPVIRRQILANYKNGAKKPNVTNNESNSPEDAIIVTKSDLEPKNEVITENNNGSDAVIAEEEVKPKKRRTKKIAETEENQE